MRKLAILFIFPLVLLACSSQSEYEKVISDYLQTKDGVKTDLKIEFLVLKVSDITVSDSITILLGNFELEKNKRIESAEKSVKHWQNAIQEQKGKKNQLVAKALISDYSEKVIRAESELKIALEWKPDYLNKYESHNSSDILAKKAECKFSFLNPQLHTRQEMNALFILSADGKQCNNMIKQ